LKKAFSLIELMIVIVIIGVVYTLAVSNFEDIKDGKTKITMLNLKEYLQKIPHEKSVELLCLDVCSSCNIFVDGQEYMDSASFDDLIDDSVEVYRYDFLLGVQEQSKKVYFNSENIEEDVCFSFSIDKQGVSDQVLVEFKDKVYDFTTHIGSIGVYDSIQELMDAKEILAQELIR
jgi:prepilin-type N-terminal cleavage/methylation domain-containing protein